MGKRWANPDYLAGLAEAEGAPELIKFWRSPVFGEKFRDLPAFLLPRLAEMATEVPDTHLGRPGIPPGMLARRHRTGRRAAARSSHRDREEDHPPDQMAQPDS